MLGTAGMIPRLVLWMMLPVAIGCNEPAALGEACHSPESGDEPACEGDALCISAPGENSDYRCAAPCAAEVEGCTRERCDDFCIPQSCVSTADCPFGTVCEGTSCLVVID
jgi:hypothetical protein